MRILAVLLLLPSTTNIGCKSSHPLDERSEAAVPASTPSSQQPSTVSLQPVASSTASPLVTPYPLGRWRLASLEALDRVMLWPAHILIRSRDVPEGLLSFELPDWAAAPPAPTRTRDEALVLAQHLADQVEANPADFARLATAHSEDPVTRHAGGALGGVTAFFLYRWPEVLDALASLQPGQTSRVVETQYGFHIFRLEQPPAERTLNGRRVVISYDTAPWLAAFLARGPLPKRSHEEARVLAQHIYQQARENPAAFPALVDRYDEHRDAQRQGDFGAWSTREPTPFASAVRELTHLEVGEIAAPIDTAFGFQVIQRTPDRERERFTTAWIQLSFDPQLPDTDESSQQGARRRAAELVQALKEDPARLEQMQSEICRRETVSWAEGQGDVREEAAARSLAPGEVLLTSLELGQRIIILKRLPNAPLLPSPVQFQLPAPQKPDVEYYFSRVLDLDTLVNAGKKAALELGSNDEEAEHLRVPQEVLDALVAAPTPALQRAVIENQQGQVAHALGPKRYARYRTILEAEVERQLMTMSAPVEPDRGP